MTTFNKSSLQNLWINGFVPQGSDYTNLIQSQVNIAETALQAMAGALSVTELDSPLVSATNITTTTISAGSVYTNSLIALGGGTFHLDVGAVNVSAQGSVTFDAQAGSNNFNSSTSFNVSAGTSLTLNAGGAQTYNTASSFNVSAQGALNLNTGSTRSDNITSNYTLNVGINYTVSAQNNIALNAVALNINAPTKVSGSFARNQAIVSATGTAQATGAAISSTVGIVRLQGTTDGQTTGFLLPAPASANIEQILIHEGTVSGNLWPSVGCKINGLSTNAAFALAANTPYYVIYTQASAYAVK